MHRIVGLDQAQDSLRAATLQGGFRGFAIQDVRSALLNAETGLKGALAELGLVPPLGPDDTIAVALPGAQVASHLLTLPFTDQKRIEQVLPAEVEGAIPFDLDEVVWDYSILNQANGKTDVLVAVVRKSVLRDTLAAYEQAGLDPRVITYAPLALAAVGERGLLENAQQGAISAALLDAGPDRADLTVLENGRPALARALTTAGMQAWTAAQSDEAARARLLGILSRDLKISLRASGKKPEKLLLAGAIAALEGATQKLSAELQLTVEVAPLPAGSAETALALGLALRAQSPRGRINFRKGEFAFTKDLSQVRGQIGRLAVAAVVLLGLALGLGMARLSSLKQQAAAYDEAVCSATKRILGNCITDYRQAIGQLSGGKSRAAGIPRVSAADVLAEVVAHMPEGALPLLDDAEVTTRIIRVKGTADSFGKVDDIRNALQKDKCFGEIKQPRVEKQRDGTKVTFSLDFPYVCSGEAGGGA